MKINLGKNKNDSDSPLIEYNETYSAKDDSVANAEKPLTVDNSDSSEVNAFGYPINSPVAKVEKRKRRMHERPAIDVNEKPDEQYYKLAHRPEGMVQVPMVRRQEDTRNKKIESLIIFLVISVFYSIVGYITIVNYHVVSFEALDRLNRALMIWHNDPPKLAALGFNYPPFMTMAMLPFTIFVSMAKGLVSLPVSSAVFAGLTFVSLNRIFERCSMNALVRYGILILLALNPMLMFYGSNGIGAFVGLSLITWAFYCIISWFVTVDTRYLIGAGMAFSIACLANYSSLIWAFLAMGLIGGVLRRHHASGEEIESSLVTFISPVVYVVSLWTLFNMLILGNPFAWVAVGETISVNVAGSSSTTVATSLMSVVTHTVSLIAGTSPLTFAVLPILFVLALIQKNELAAWIGGFLLVAVVNPGVQALITNDETQLLLREGLTINILTIIGAAWIYRSLESLNIIALVLIVVGVLVSIPFSLTIMKSYRYQNMEDAFVHALETRKSQEGTLTNNGQKVGIVDEQAMSSYIEENIKQKNSILTDNSQTYAVMLLTGRPDMFVDRIDNGDGSWHQKITNPPKSVHYMLFLKNKNNIDQLSAKYPLVTTGQDKRFRVMYETVRYMLVKIPENRALLNPKKEVKQKKQAAPTNETIQNQLQTDPTR